MEAFFVLQTTHLDAVINKLSAEQLAQQLQEQQQAAQDVKGGKPGQQAPPKKDAAGKGAKKGGKDDLQVYESPLGATIGGIESCVLLLDIDLFSLPFEALPVFRAVPAISRDFSLIQLGVRFKKIGFKAELNNSTGIAKDKIKYIAYNFKAPLENQLSKVEANRPKPIGDCNLEPIVQQFAKDNPAFKIEGIASSKRIASIGEWQHYVQSSEMIMFYGHPGLLDILSPKLIMNFNDTSKVKAFILIDKINAHKDYLEKTSTLDPEPNKTALQENLKNVSILLSVIGAANICTTQWAVQTELYPEICKHFLKSLSSEIYFSAFLQEYKNEDYVQYVDSKGRFVDKSKYEEYIRSTQQQQQPQAQSKDLKKGKPVDKKAEELQIAGQDLQKEGDSGKQPEPAYKEVKLPKTPLQKDGIIFIGVPVLRIA